MDLFPGRKIRLVSLFALALLYVAGMNPIWAQVAASITGKIEDPSGASIPGANVTVISMETGAARTMTADDSGNYRIMSLPVGPYEVRAEKPGFKAQIQTGINLVVGQQAVVNLRLEVGAVQEQVTVTGDAPLVNTTTSSMAGLVGEKQVKELPINGRSFDLLIALNAATVNFTSVLKQGAGNVGGNLFSVVGRRPSENFTMMNGVEYTGSGNAAVSPGGASGQLLGIDAVREYNVVTDNYGAEYGKRAGAQVTVVTQSGTNQLHGSAFEFLRNSALDARNFFDKGSIPPFERNQFGGALGGPIRRDKTFIFGNYEGFRQRLGQSSVIFVPDLNLRQGMVPCVNGGVPACAAGAAVGTPTLVPNIDPRSLQLANFLYPVPNGPSLGGGVAQFASNPTQTIRQDFGTTRFDQTISRKDTFSSVYMIDDGLVITPAANQISVANGLIRNQIASLQETHIFSPQVINTLTAGFSRIRNENSVTTTASFPANLAYVKGEVPGIISIGSAGNVSNSTSLTSVNGGAAQPTTWNRTLFTYSDGLQIVKGKHQVSAGIWFQRVRANEYDPLRANGQATFTNLTTMLQGQATSFSIAPVTTEMGWRTWLGAWYLQDSIQLRPNLTVRLGLRHEFSNGWSESTGRAATVLFDQNGVVQTNPRISDHLNLNNNSKWLFSPRIGIAWDPFGKGKTSIRAAVGTYYDMVDTLSYFADVTPPLAGAADFANVPLFSVIPIDRSATLPPPCGPGVPAPCNIYSMKSDDPNLKVPTVESWTFGIEQQLTRQTALRLGYVGSESYHQFFNTDPNSIPAQVCSNPAGCRAGGVNAVAAQSTVPQGTRYIPVGNRPNPYLTYGLFLFTQGVQSYHGFQAELVQRLAKGLQFRGNYTWSHNLDTGSAVIGTVARDDSPHYNTNQGVSNKGSAAFDIRHAVHANFGYELPFGEGKRWLSGAHGIADKLVSGWQVNSIMTFLSGFPITPITGSNRSGSGDLNNPDRPSLAPGASNSPTSGATAGCGGIIPAGQKLGTATRWFDPCAYVLPPGGTFGDAGRGIISGAGLAIVDFSVFKNTLISERIRLQFRGEVFNALNHTNLGIPNFNTFSGTAYNPQAGVITVESTTSRQMQFGLKLIF